MRAAFVFSAVSDTEPGSTTSATELCQILEYEPEYDEAGLFRAGWMGLECFLRLCVTSTVFSGWLPAVQFQRLHSSGHLVASL